MDSTSTCLCTCREVSRLARHLSWHRVLLYLFWMFFSNWPRSWTTIRWRILRKWVQFCRYKKEIISLRIELIWFGHSIGWSNGYRISGCTLPFRQIFPRLRFLSSSWTRGLRCCFVSHRPWSRSGCFIRIHFWRFVTSKSFHCSRVLFASISLKIQNQFKLSLLQLCIVAIYVGLLGMTMGAVSWHLSRNQTSNTRVRKIFHILIVLVFVPGLIYQCTFLFVASGVALALLILLELVRIIQLKPFAEILQQAVKSFVDEKDAGVVAMTPLYLLVGCSLPIWLHPCPCDLTDAAGFELLPLMAGVISVGLGDTAASVIGSKFGRIHWPSKKNYRNPIDFHIVNCLFLLLQTASKPSKEQ